MRSCVVAFLLANSAIFFARQASFAEQAHIAGRDYVRLADWAKNKGLSIVWLRHEELLQVSSSSTKLIFRVDSSEAQINGVKVWLLFPAIYRNGSAYVSELDITTTLLPILSPPKTRSNATIKTICLDPGHGGSDPGFQVGFRQEKKFTLLLAQEVRQQLTRAGLKVVLTRNSDTFIDLPLRPDFARRRNADLFVSLHFNSAGSAGTVVRGSEVYCLTPAGASSTNARGEGAGAGSYPGNRNNEKNMFLAYELQKSLTGNMAVEDRGLRRARFAVLRDATMPAVLIEAGFMSHPEESRRIFDPGYRREMARAIVDGLLAYKHEVER
jgi:N-acetylmuramoyl-L-alanine amidase